MRKEYVTEHLVARAIKEMGGAPHAESTPILNFYMGKNTPGRKDYITDKLVVAVEESLRALQLHEQLALSNVGSAE